MSRSCRHETVVPRRMGKGEEQGEKQMAHSFQGPQLLAEANGLSQPKKAETVKAGPFLCPNKTLTSSSMKRPIIFPSQIAYSGLCIYDRRYSHHLL